MKGCMNGAEKRESGGKEGYQSSKSKAKKKKKKSKK